ncbi:MAG: FAD-dependent oxidoreductase [Clostridia bacterium]|nr:FAD-dependent oxidoreductase [Clostridia bacterium]
MSKEFDLIIIGAGPAGLSAGLYGSQAKLKVAIFEKGFVGGQVSLTSNMANYPGYTEKNNAAGLVNKMQVQCEENDVHFIYEEIVEIKKEGMLKKIFTNKGEYLAKTIIIATGNRAKKLGAEGEEKLIGRGISYCALCDGVFFSDYEVFVVGAGNSAIEESIFLTKFVKKVTILNRSEKVKASRYYIARAEENEKIDIISNVEIKKVNGQNGIESILVENKETGEEKLLGGKNDNYGLFIFIGRKPNTELFSLLLDLDEKGYIITDEKMKTSVDGIYAAGDVRVKDLRQVVTATSDGAIAAVEAEKYIERLESSAQLIGQKR